MTDSPTSSNLATRRPSSRIKPQYPLPTDRLSMEKQKSILKAFVVASQGGTVPVGAAKLSNLTNIAEVTVPLNNAFFESVELLERTRRGMYLPTDDAKEFVRVHSFDSEAAGLTLARNFEDKWFFYAVRDRLKMSSASKNEVIEAIARTAGTDSSYRIQIGFLLEWMDYAGLVNINGDEVTLPSVKVATSLMTPAHVAERTVQVVPEPAVAPISQPTKVALDSPSAVIAFNFELALTNDDLEKLTGEQIHALFTGVGQIASIKAAISK